MERDSLFQALDALGGRIDAGGAVDGDVCRAPPRRRPARPAGAAVGTAGKRAQGSARRPPRLFRL